MPGTITTTTPKGEELKFIEASHIYTLNGKRCTSVTKFVNSFFEPFKEDVVAEICAKKRGITKEEVKEEWDAARRYGTRTHEVCEDVMNGNPIRNTGENSRELAIFPCAKNAATKVLSMLSEIHPELPIADKPHNLAGTADLFGKLKKPTKEGHEYLLLDWKTNKDITKEGFKGKCGLGPCSDVQDSNYWHYALQLSTYEYIIRTNGYAPSDAKIKRVLAHFVYDPISKEANTVYDVMPDMTSTVMKMISNWSL